MGSSFQVTKSKGEWQVSSRLTDELTLMGASHASIAESCAQVNAGLCVVLGRRATLAETNCGPLYADDLTDCCFEPGARALP